MWLRLIVETILVALSAVSLSGIVRTLGFVRPLVARGVKPWSCDVCLSFWTTLLVGLVIFLASYSITRTARLDSLVVVVPAHGLALLLLSRLRPPEIPPLEEGPA